MATIQQHKPVLFIESIKIDKAQLERMLSDLGAGEIVVEV